MIKKFLFSVLSVTLLSASDTVTIGGLEWQDTNEAKSIEKSWKDARSYCEHLSLAGKDDWRLPSIKELQSIVDISRYKPAIKSNFKNVASEEYWSSSVDVSAAKYAWFVGFKSGFTYYGSKTAGNYVRCVRGRQ